MTRFVLLAPKWDFHQFYYKGPTFENIPLLIN